MNNDTKLILEKLDLLVIDGYKFQKPLNGGSALSGIFSNGFEKIVIKFLISPRNDIELNRFKLEYEVLIKNRIFWLDTERDITEHFQGPVESYPLPRAKINLQSTLNNQVWYFAYEFIEGTLLSDFTYNSIDIETKFKLLHRVASGLNYFWQVGYEHRDLHPGNIILKDGYSMKDNGEIYSELNDPRVVFLDLGNCQRNSTWDLIAPIERSFDEESVFIDNNKRMLTSFTSMPPDFILKGKRTKNYDSWAFGVFTYKLLFNKMPFPLNSLDEVYSLAQYGIIGSPFLSDFRKFKIPEGIQHIIYSLLSPNGDHRPSIDTIVRLFAWIVYDRNLISNSKFALNIIRNEGYCPSALLLDD